VIVQHQHAPLRGGSPAKKEMEGLLAESKIGKLSSSKLVSTSISIPELEDGPSDAGDHGDDSPAKKEMEGLLAESKIGKLSSSKLVSTSISIPGAISLKDRDGATVLHWASLHGNTELVNTCITLGSDVR